MAQALEEMRELQSAKGGADTSIGARPPTPLFLSTLSLSPSLSLSLLLSLSLPSPVSHTLFQLCLCLACCLPRAWQHACKKLGNKHARSLRWVGFNLPSHLLRCTTLVCGDNWSQQSGVTTGANSLEAKPWEAFLEYFATPLQRLSLCDAFAHEDARKPKPQSRNPKHDT
jgi:hypothetical protein